jgi:hypothetical protein
LGEAFSTERGRRRAGSDKLPASGASGNLPPELNQQRRTFPETPYFDHNFLLSVVREA